MTSIKKVLLLTPELPFPPVSGGKLKSWKLVDFLSQHYQLSIGCILKSNDEDHLHDFIMACPIDKFYFRSVKRGRSLLNLAKSYLASNTLNLYRTFNQDFMQVIAKEIHQYEMVIVDHYEVFQYIPEDYQGKIVLHEHNAYYLMWERYAQNKKNSLLKRLVSFIESLRVKKYEKYACMRSDRIFASPNDIDTLVDLDIPKDKFRYTYHLGDDKQLYFPELTFQNTQKSLLYVGSLNWEANIDGLIWFISDIWGKLKQKNPELKFTIIGGNPDSRLVNLVNKQKDIELAGFVKDLEPYFQTHRVFVAPLKYGAGMKVKVLNAMGRGMPIVTTSIGSEGIDIESFKHLIVADDNEQQVEAITQLLQDSTLWNELKLQSRQLINEKYTWTKLFADMKQELDELMLDSINSSIESNDEKHKGLPEYRQQRLQLIRN